MNTTINYGIKPIMNHLAQGKRWMMLTILMLHANESNRCWPKRETIMTMAGIDSTATFAAAKAWLIEHKAIKLIPLEERKKHDEPARDETRLHPNRTIYQLTGIIKIGDVIFPYLYNQVTANGSTTKHTQNGVGSMSKPMVGSVTKRLLSEPYKYFHISSLSISIDITTSIPYTSLDTRKVRYTPAPDGCDGDVSNSEKNGDDGFLQKQQLLIAAGVGGLAIDDLATRFTAQQITNVTTYAAQHDLGPGWIVTELNGNIKGTRDKLPEPELPDDPIERAIQATQRANAAYNARLRKSLEKAGISRKTPAWVQESEHDPIEPESDPSAQPKFLTADGAA